jgi:pimeloyl-ACP methyl ester carboxylesterase
VSSLQIVAYALVDSAAAYAVMLAGLRAYEDRLLLHPKRRSPDMGQPAECLVTQWTPEGRYAGLIVTKDNTDNAPRGTILIFHGNAGTAEGRVPLAAKFAHLGYRGVITEYPGFGHCEGAPRLQDSVEACRIAYANARRTWAGPLTLCGESLGAGMAGQIVAENQEEISAVILSTPWDSLTALAQAKLPIVPAARMLRYPFDTVKALQGYKGPVVVIASEQDRLIPVRHARVLAGSVPHSVLVPLHAGHNDWFRRMTPQHWAVVNRALGAPSA